MPLVLCPYQKAEDSKSCPLLFGASVVIVFFEKVPVFKGLHTGAQRYLRKLLLVQAMFGSDVFKF